MKNKLIFGILIIGIVYRLFLTANGNFLFNMDNARDMLDVREMVVLHKLRLTGPTSAITGLFNGPAWYYLLAVPFLLSGGSPYAEILMEIILWAIGGYFLLKLVSKWGSLLILPIGGVWIASNYITLTNLYAFNPNPVTLLAPLFIFLLLKFLETGKSLYGISVWFLAGLFFNFEMNAGVFMPVIILVSIILSKNLKLLKQKTFWAGLAAFVITLLPQILFDLKHQFLMSKAVLVFLHDGNGGGKFNPLLRIPTIAGDFFNTFIPTLMNHQTLSVILLLLFLVVVLKKWRQILEKDLLVLISLIYILVPFLGYLIIPVTVNPWHLGGEMSVSLILLGYLLEEIWHLNWRGKIVSVVLGIFLVIYAISNVVHFFVSDFGKPSGDPSLYRNETAAIDYVYQKANGKNFKVYTYLPSVYDFPYQYLFWWYGKKTYGYIPGDYAYSPNKPPYVASQSQFYGSQTNYSGLVFLIKEPDHNYTRPGWEGAFVKLPTISTQMVGPIEVEIRKEHPQ